MKQKRDRVAISLWIIGLVICLFFWILPKVWAASNEYTIPVYLSPDVDSVTLDIWVDHDSTSHGVMTGTNVRDTTLTLDNSDHNMILEKYWFSGYSYPSSGIDIFALPRYASGDSVWFKHRLFMPEAWDSVVSYWVANGDSTSIGTYAAGYSIADSLHIPDTIFATIIDLIYYYGDTIPLPYTIDFYPAGSVPPAASPTANMVAVYLDVTGGLMDSATAAAIPRAAITLNLRLVGGQVYRNSGWGIVPQVYPVHPNSAGRAIWYVPANTQLSPAGSSYEVTWVALDRRFQGAGSLGRYVIDTTPDPCNILTEATRVR